MKWSKLKSNLKERLAPSMRDRMALYQARYRNTLEESGRVWLTLDGREIASFETAPYIARRHEVKAGILEANALRPDGDPNARAAYSDADEQAQDILRRSGEYDDYRALIDLEAYLSLSIEDALTSPSPLVRALAVVDGRVGKRRLRALIAEGRHHPLVSTVLLARCEAEGVEFEPPAP
jgi:hypothetical protein